MAEPIIREYIPRPRTLRDRLRLSVYEMIGRSEQFDTVAKIVSSKYKYYKTIPSIDSSRTIYGLSRAIFYASIYQDRLNGKSYGANYLLGAGFGAPIVNIATSFALGQAPQIMDSATDPDKEILEGQPETVDVPDPLPEVDDLGRDVPPEVDPDEPNPETEKLKEKVKSLKKANPTINNINQWLEEQIGFLWIVARNSLRDGDAFIIMDDDGTMVEVAPEEVDIVLDPLKPGQIAGYDVYTTVEDQSKSAPDNKTTYLDEIRTTYRERFIIDRDNKKVKVPGTRLEYSEETRLPVVHWANEKEARQLYGTSDFQGLYYFMANYHAVLESGVKGNIYNNTPVPWISTKNVRSFMESNGTKQEDGTYKVAWDQDQMLIGGEDFKAAMLQPDDVSTGTMNICNILFWIICQRSETPEFAFGTAVSSSKASVSEQTPVLVKKAIRKQQQFQHPIRELIELYIEKMSKLKPKEFKPDTQFKLDMPSIIDDDMNINIEIVKLMLDEGSITLKTAMIMLNLRKYVSDLDRELIKAELEKKDRQPAPTDVFGQPVGNSSNDNPQAMKVKAALKQATEVQEMAKRIHTKEDLANFIAEYDGKLTEEDIAELRFTLVE